MSCLSLSWNDLSQTLCSSKLWVMNYFQTRGLFKEEKILQQAGAARILLPKRGSFHTVTVGSDGWALASVSTMATNSHFHSNGSSSRSSSSTTATVVGTSLLTTTSVLNTHFYRSLFQHSLLLLSKDKAETQALKKKTSSTTQRAEKLLFFVHVFVAFAATSTITLFLFFCSG